MNFEIVNVAPELQSTDLDDAFFEEHTGSVFGREDCSDSEEEWIRTTSGRAATILLTAEDENESVGVLQFATGESEVRRCQSYRPCLFGPASSDAEDFESDNESVETDTEDDEDESEDLSGLPERLPELPNIADPSLRRNRGASWLKMNSLGQLFDKENDAQNEPPKRMTMDAFGNFVVAGADYNTSGAFFEHIKMKQNRKRLPQTMETKRSPPKSKSRLTLSSQKNMSSLQRRTLAMMRLLQNLRE